MAEPDDELPDDCAFWRFSLAFYERAGVSEALIALQDRAGLDINLVLFAIWIGVSGRGRLASEELTTADLLIRPIRTDIVEPLRALRRKLRFYSDADVLHLREGIKALELAAEEAIQKRLGRAIRPTGNAADPAAPVSAALANFALYLGDDMARSPEAAAIGKALEAFLGE
jgi:uncharacterized protein (TIGR02444 family)